MDEERATKYLVTGKDGKTHLPYTGDDGKPDHKLMGDAWAALHGGFRGKKYDGPNKAEAIAKLKAVYKSEGMKTPDEKDSLAQYLEEQRARHAELDEVWRSATYHPSDGVEDPFMSFYHARAACYAGMNFASMLPDSMRDLVSDGHYSSMYDAHRCIGTYMDLASRESPIAPVGAQLCGAACRQVAKESAATEGGINDGFLRAISDSCLRCADRCDELVSQFRSATEKDEIRSCTLELRSEGESRKIVGYPIVFNSLSQDLGGFVERILPDAVQFAEDVRADFNHDANCILGRLSAGTLTLSVDDHGVRMEAEAPKTTWADDLLVSIRRGDINQGSFAFRVLPGGDQVAEENGQMVRTLTRILVRKVSVVSDPAYTKTEIEVRQNPGSAGDTAGQEAPPATFNGEVDLLRRVLDEKEREI